MERAKLLFVSSDSTRTGAPGQILMLATRLKEAFQVSCACPDGWLKEELGKQGIKTHLWPEESLLNQRRTLTNIYVEVQPQLIHCHGVRAGIIGRLVARPKESKVVYTEHLWTEDFHLASPLREQIQHQLLAQAAHHGDWLIGVSQAVSRFVTKKYRLDPKKVGVIYGAISPMPQAIPPKAPTLGTVGRLTSYKDIATLLRAVAILTKKWPDIRLIVGGDGPAKNEYQQLAQELKIGERCHWAGKVNYLPDFLRQLSVYVQPSTSESFGQAAGEAMAAGLPVIVSNVGGLPELIDDCGAGLLFNVKDPVSLAQQIEKVISNQDLRKSMGQNARVRAAEFSVDRFVSEHEKLYAQLLAKK